MALIGASWSGDGPGSQAWRSWSRGCDASVAGALGQGRAGAGDELKREAEAPLGGLEGQARQFGRDSGAAGRAAGQQPERTADFQARLQSPRHSGAFLGSMQQPSEIFGHWRPGLREAVHPAGVCGSQAVLSASSNVVEFQAVGCSLRTLTHGGEVGVSALRRVRVRLPFLWVGSSWAPQPPPPRPQAAEIASRVRAPPR